MDDTMKQKLDTVIEDDIRQGFRIKTLPPELVRQLEETHEADPAVQVFSTIRFVKLTPRRRRLINEAVMRRYHLDLQDKTILSNEQLRKLNIERGEWSSEQEKRLEQLSDETNTMMRDLYLDGFDRRSEWTEELVTLAGRVRSAVDESADGELAAALSEEDRAEFHRRFTRWMDWTPEQQEAYTTAHAASQGLEAYSVDRDYQWMLDHTPNVQVPEFLASIDDLRDKLRRYVELLVKRRELVELQVKQSKMFAESVEHRRDAAEEMARMYFCTERLDGAGHPAGPVAKTFDGCWDLPDDVVQWLIVEGYLFLNGIPDEGREFLAQWGFLGAPRESGSSQPSDGSLAAPTPSSDGQSAAETPAASTGSATATS